MNSRTLRRLAADHNALHTQPLPPNYLFPPGNNSSDDLTTLDILLAGPTHTPFASGLFKLHFSIPPTYPTQPPTANFRTPIFHPNVDPNTGGVCVETLKRDWDAKLTLRDVLVTISCLLIQPNPDSALNAEAGALIREDYEGFGRRAEMYAGIHAAVPRGLESAVKEAQTRGQEEEVDEEPAVEAPVRRRRTIAKVRSQMRRGDASPIGAPTQRRQLQPPPQSQPFVFQSGNDDVFGASTSRPREPTIDEDTDDAEQENDTGKSPMKASTPPRMTPRRPHGVAVPLGELIMDHSDQEPEDTSEEMEAEYPPSPQKSSSPRKSPAKRRQARQYSPERPESSRAAALRNFNITPPNLSDKPLASDSPFTNMDIDVTFENSVSPRKQVRRGLFDTPPKRPGNPLFRDVSPDFKMDRGGVVKPKSPSSAERRREEEKRRAELWRLCGEDIGRWNRGDFDGEPFQKKAGRW